MTDWNLGRRGDEEEQCSPALAICIERTVSERAAREPTRNDNAYVVFSLPARAVRPSQFSLRFTRETKIPIGR
jgi:hypothetical protein